MPRLVFNPLTGELDYVRRPDEGTVAFSQLRTGQELLGTKNGSNTSFIVPYGDTFIHDLPRVTIMVYLNGIRLSSPDDYTVLEGGGLGAGYDTVELDVPPRANDHLLADYIATMLV